jgi:hypothetical protein
MDTKIPYEDREDEIRLALVKMAKGRKKLDHEKFGALVAIPIAGPWNPRLDKISLRERAAGRPDITYLVVKKGRAILYKSNLNHQSNAAPEDTILFLVGRRIR